MKVLPIEIYSIVWSKTSTMYNTNNCNCVHFSHIKYIIQFLFCLLLWLFFIYFVVVAFFSDLSVRFVNINGFVNHSFHIFAHITPTIVIVYISHILNILFNTNTYK
jgi:hypothetical protein